MEHTIEQIINGCIKKDAKYQKLLYDKYSAICFGICRKNSRCKQDAEDMFQEGFIKLFDKIEKYSFIGSFEAWLRQFFYFFAWNWYRGKKTVRYYEQIDDSTPTTNYNLVLDDYTNEQLLHILEQLPNKERQVFTMIAIEGLSIEEICKNLNIKPATILSLQSRAKQKVLKSLYNLLKY